MKNMQGPLARILERYGLREELHQLAISKFYPELFAGIIASRSQPVSLDDGILTVRVQSPALRNELKMRESEMMAAINERLNTKSEIVRKILFI